MGAYLTKPITDKETHGDKDSHFEYGVSAMQGWRTSMEDAHVATLGLGEVPTSAFFGVYDGHGGAQVARFCSLTMPNELLKNGAYQSGDVGPALKQTFLEIDNLLKRRDNMEVLEKLKADGGEEAGLGQLPVSLQKLLQNQMQKEDTNDGTYQGPGAGCTAVVAVVVGKTLYVANAGDSRCVLCRGTSTVSLTDDHKPTDPEEEARILAAGGFVTDGRVNGCLNLSRAIGDMNYKQSANKPAEEQIVTANPDIREIELTAEDRFILLACDGIWDILTNEEAVDFISERLNQGKTPSEVCEMLCDRCLASTSDGIGKGCDNMSAMIVLLKTPGQ